MSGRRREQRLGLGVLLLAFELYRKHLHRLPPVTLLMVVGQALLYMGIINVPWNPHDVCLSGDSIVYGRDYRRLILSAMEHGSDIHLYHNMASLILKGQSLERRYGSLKFLILLLVFTLASSLTYVGLAYGAAELFQSYSHMMSCAIGFSGVLFALKVVTTYHSDSNYQSVHGIRFSSKYAVWAELVIIHLLVPNASFIGHLAGILVGLAYVYGPLWDVVDYLCQLLDPGTASRGGRRQQQYGWNFH